jgi:hypothetical protein
MDLLEKRMDFHERFREQALFESQLWFFLSLEDRQRINSAIKNRTEEIRFDKLIDIAENMVKNGE